MGSRVAVQESPGRAERLGLAWAWCATLILIATLLAWVIAVDGTDGVRSLGQHAVISVALIGKYIIFSGVRPDSVLTAWHFAVMVWAIDLFVALFILTFVDWFSSVPLVGFYFERARRKAHRKLEKYPRLENMAFWGVVLLVFLPLASTGAIIGSFAGQLVGLRRLTTVFAVALGSAMTAVLFGTLAAFMGEGAENILRSEVFIGICMAGLIVFGVWAYAQVRHIVRRRRKRGESTTSSSEYDLPAGRDTVSQAGDTAGDI